MSGAPDRLNVLSGLALASVLWLAACSSKPAEPSPEQHSGGTVASGSVAACVPDIGGAVRERKDRIAKGIFYASRLRQGDGPLERWDTPFGPFWVVAGNFRTFAEVLAEQTVKIYGDGPRGVQPGDVVIDGGAHFGGFTRTALDSGARVVVSVDIAPENIQVLRRNFAPEIAAGRVIIVEKGLWDGEGTLVLERQNNTWADHVSSEGAGPTVAMRTLDSIVAELKLDSVNFIKLDIEGAERKAIAGAAGTLKAHRPRMSLAAYHEPDDIEAITRAALASQPTYEVCVNGRDLGHGYTTLFFK
jgi:FkbM family methyltransferase